MGLVMLWLGVGLLCGASHAVAREGSSVRQGRQGV